MILGTHKLQLVID